MPDINKILAEPGNSGCSIRGASMGRRQQVEGNPETLYLQKIRLVDHDYDTGGAYWGQGIPLWCAFSPDDTLNAVPIRIFVRSSSRDGAKTKVLSQLPGTGWSFFR